MDLAALIRLGTQLTCEMADFDSCDTYQIQIEAVAKDGSELACHWKLDGCNDNGEIKVDQQTLASANTVATISQGTVMPDPKEAKALPPFLVSRDLASALRNGKPGKIQIAGLSDEVEPVGSEQRKIQVDGQTVKVTALEASGEEITLWIFDDPVWPILLAAEFEGDNYTMLKSITSK